MGEAVPQDLFLFIAHGELHSVFLFPVRYPVGCLGIACLGCDSLFSNWQDACKLSVFWLLQHVWCALKNLKLNIYKYWEIKTGDGQ